MALQSLNQNELIADKSKQIAFQHKKYVDDWIILYLNRSLAIMVQTYWENISAWQPGHRLLTAGKYGRQSC